MVESVALEMRSAGNGTEGSNPSLSSNFPHFRPRACRPDGWPELLATHHLMVTSDGAASAPTAAPTTRNNMIATMTTTTV